MFKNKIIFIVIGLSLSFNVIGQEIENVKGNYLYINVRYGNFYFKYSSKMKKSDEWFIDTLYIKNDSILEIKEVCNSRHNFFNHTYPIDTSLFKLYDSLSLIGPFLKEKNYIINNINYKVYRYTTTNCYAYPCSASHLHVTKITFYSPQFGVLISIDNALSNLSDFHILLDIQGNSVVRELVKKIILTEMIYCYNGENIKNNLYKMYLKEK